MRVVHICNLPLSLDHPDCGRISLHPGRWVLNLAIAQKKFASIEPELVVQVPGGSRSFSTLVEGIKVHYVAAPNRLRAATFFLFDVLRLSKVVRNLQANVVHAHGTEEAYLLAAQASRRPNLVTAQGCYFIINRELPPPPISRARLVEFTEWLGLRRARHVIAKSSYVGGELKSRFPSLQIHQIPNTFDARLLNIPLDRARQPFSLAFVGTVVERKGVHFLADAVEQILSGANEAARSIVLHVFGNRPDSPSPYETAVIERLRRLLGDRLILHGTIPALKVAEALSEIQVLVAPSLEEMFGNQLIETLLVGTDPIVTDETAMAENLRSFEAGWIVPQQNPGALARVIQEALSKPPTHERVRAIRERVASTMGPQVVAEAHARVYEEIRASR